MKKCLMYTFALTAAVCLMNLPNYYFYHFNASDKMRRNQESGNRAIHSFTSDSQILIDSNSTNTSDTSVNKALFSIQIRQNNTVLHHPQLYFPGEALPTYDEKRVSVKDFPRVLDLKLERSLFNLMIEFTSMLSHHGIAYCMAHGMLLGSYLFHTMIPWDDDIDLFIDIKDINTLKAMFRTKAFRKKYGVHSHWERNMYSDSKLKEEILPSDSYSCGVGAKKNTRCYKQGKVYYKNAPRAGRMAWTYPFVDFTFMKNNGTHIFNHERSQETKVILPVQEFYPFILRPFHNLWLPAPRNTALVLKLKFKQFRCTNGYYDHVHEENRRSWKRTVPCYMLKDSYPYVRRRKYINQSGFVNPDKLTEDLMLGDKILHSVVIDTGYKSPDVLSLPQDSSTLLQRMSSSNIIGFFL